MLREWRAIDGPEGPLGEGASSGRSAVASAAELDAADVINDGPAGASSLAIGASVDVIIETLGDHDWYKVTLVAGTTYTIHTSFDATFTDALLAVRNSVGVLLQSDDDSGERNNALLGFTPTSSGTYYIDAGTFSDDTTGSFHLSLAAVVEPGDVVGGTTGGATAFAVRGSVDGHLDSSADHDYYRIALTAGQTYIFRTGGTVASTDTDTRLTLRDANGGQLASNDDAGEGMFSGIRYTAPTTGDYYLDVSGYGGATGAFNLTAFTTPAPQLFTTDEIADQLADGYWQGNAHRFAVTAGQALTFNVQALTAAGQTLAREALSLWGDVTGLVFNEVFSGGQLVYDDSDEGAYTAATYSGGVTSSAEINVSSQWLTSYGSGLGSYAFQTYVHETGHALGLGHAGNYNTTADYGVDSLYLNDSWAATVMSYFDQTENTYFKDLGFTRQFVLTPMVADAIAAATLYGGATATRIGNTTYGFNNTSGRAIFDAATYPSASYTIYDNGGADTLDFSGFSASQVIDLNAEAFSSVGGRVGNVAIARGTVIENAVGGSGNDTVTGNDAANVLRLNAGGNDTVSGGNGDDGFYFGASLAAGDAIDGGAGGNDQLGLQGNYGTSITPMTLSAGHLVNVELLALLSGTNAAFGDTAGNLYDYRLKTVDANVAAGRELIVSFNQLTAGEDVRFDGSAETDGWFLTYGGFGFDQVTGGQLNDGFFFGADRWTGGDAVSGQGGGNDQLGLQGNFSGADAVVFNGGQLSGIEMIVLLTGGDSRFGSGGLTYSYDLTMNNGNVAAGQTLYIVANALAADETLTFDGTAELDGRFIVYGGDGRDRIRGGAGADTLYGGGGNDAFIYVSAAHSAPGARDAIGDFTTGDWIGLSAIDAIPGGIDDVFTFIGSAAFGHVAGQLRAGLVGGNDWLVQGDIDGNGLAEIELLVTVTDGSPIGALDFVL
ncbi:MAG TPA: M10 family metallopeptidase C-terminal domain-containing protein [Croceibacterium sp.]|nr:M10 family metallopeptidase C-terminal domain-containing protein [Croceibacterium sp.]